MNVKIEENFHMNESYMCNTNSYAVILTIYILLKNLFKVPLFKRKKLKKKSKSG